MWEYSFDKKENFSGLIWRRLAPEITGWSAAFKIRWITCCRHRLVLLVWSDLMMGRATHHQVSCLMRLVTLTVAAWHHSSHWCQLRPTSPWILVLLDTSHMTFFLVTVARLAPPINARNYPWRLSSHHNSCIYQFGKILTTQYQQAYCYWERQKRIVKTSVVHISVNSCIYNV